MNPKKPTSYSDQIKVLTEANYKKVKSKLIFKKPKEEDYKESLEAFNILKKNLTAQFKGSDLPRQFTSKLKDIHEKELKKLNETNPGVDHYKQNLVEESLNSLGGNLGLRLFDIIEDKIDKLSQEISCGILTIEENKNHNNIEENQLIEEIVNLKKDLRFDKKKSAPDLKLIYSLPFELRKGYQKRKAAIYNSKTKTARDFSQNKIKEMEAFKEENIEWMEKKKKWLEERAEKRMEKKRKRIKEMILKRKEEREKKINNGEYFKYSAFVVDFEKEREPSYDSDGKPKPKEKFYVPFKQKNEEEILEELKKEREELRLKFSHDAIKLHSARVGKSIKIRNEETMKRIRSARRLQSSNLRKSLRDFKENNNIFKEKLDRKLKLQKKGWDLGNKYSKKNLNPNHDIRRFKTEEAKSPKREKMEEEEAKKMGLDYLKYSRAHAKKQKDKDKEKSVTLLSELDNEKAVNTNEKGTDMSILEKSVKIKPKDVGLPDDVDYIEELEKEAKKGAKLKNYNDLKSLKGRIKIVEARGLNEYEKLKYAYDLKEYMKEAESGDRMLIGAMKSKLGLISRMEPKMKNLKIKGKKEVDEGGEEGNGDVDV